MKKYGMRIAAVVCMVIMCISLFPTDGTGSKEKESCKTLCGYALKATGGAKEIEIFFGGCTGLWSAYSLSSQPGENDSVCM